MNARSDAVLVGLGNDTPFLVVSYYTREYGAEALRLAQSCRSHDIDYYIQFIKSQGSWLRNVRLRAVFMLGLFPTTAKSLVWVDADGVVRADLALFRDPSMEGYDLAAHRNSKGRYRVGTMWFANTARGRAFVERWAAAIRKAPDQTEQQALNVLLLRPHPDVRVLDFPATYCSIFDKAVDKAAGPAVIEHFQASRKLRRIIR